LEKLIKLYGGAVEIKFEEDGQKYFVKDLDEFDPEFRLYPSVTTILHKGVNKADVLVPWAVNCAVEVFNKSILPGQSYDEVQLRTIVAAMKRARYDKKEKAADIGTISHEWISKFLLKWIETGSPAQQIIFPSNPEAASCMKAALGWIDKSGYQPTLSERIIFSRRYKYIGTMDATSSTASVYGRKAVVDWKSSKGLYAEYRFQLAAYLNAIAEETGIDPDEYDRWLIKLGKEDGKFKEMKLPNEEYRRDLAAFTGMIPVFHRLNELEKIWREQRS
jgi:hypothetical protein